MMMMSFIMQLAHKTSSQCGSESVFIGNKLCTETNRVYRNKHIVHLIWAICRMYLHTMCKNTEWIMYAVMVCFSLAIDDCEDIVFILCTVVNTTCLLLV